VAQITNVKEKVKNLNLVYKVLAATQLLMGLAVYFLVKGQKPDYSAAITLQKIGLLIVPGLMAAGYFLFKYMLGRVDMSSRLEEKVNRYFTLIIMRAAFFEAAFVFCCIASAITHVELFLYMAPIAFLLFLLLRPNPADMRSDMQLTEPDAARLFE
jgi:hypothetical protein